MAEDENVGQSLDGGWEEIPGVVTEDWKTRLELIAGMKRRATKAALIVQQEIEKQSGQNLYKIKQRVQKARNFQTTATSSDVWATVRTDTFQAEWEPKLYELLRLPSDASFFDRFGNLLKVVVQEEFRGVGYQRELDKARAGEMSYQVENIEEVKTLVRFGGGSQDELALGPAVRTTYPITVWTPNITGQPRELNGNVEGVNWLGWGWKWDAATNKVVPDVQFRGFVDVVWSAQTQEKYAELLSGIYSSMRTSADQEYQARTKPFRGGIPGSGSDRGVRR